MRGTNIARGTGGRAPLTAAVAACLLFAGAAWSGAEVILGQHDWDYGPEGWSSLYGWPTVTVQDPGVGGWLRIDFFATEKPENAQDEWFDVVRVQSQDLFAGVWTPDMFIEFDFWSESVAPAALQVQWTSSTNSDVWAYELTPSPAVQQWTTYRAPFSNWTDWFFSGATEDQYLADLSSIDWIGVYIYRSGPGEQLYGIDNFKLMVPEPGEILMLCAALAVSLIALRRRAPATA